MADYKQGRAKVIAALRAELVGPSPVGSPLDFSRPVTFETREASYGPWVQVNGEEVIQRDRPTRRYGVGVLYPPRIPVSVEEQATVEEGADLVADGNGDVFVGQSADADIEVVEERLGRGGGDSDDLDLSSANDYRPSTMAVTFLAHLPAGSSLRVVATGGRYHEIEVTVDGGKRSWWVRSPVAVTAEFKQRSLLSERATLVHPDAQGIDGGDGLSLGVVAFARPWGPDRSLITLSLLNRAASSGAPDEFCLFQTSFRATIDGAGGRALIEPYPKREAEAIREHDPEEGAFNLLYRRARTFAIGHGCAADWEATESGSCSWVAAEPLPCVETPSITPEIILEDGSELRVPMGPLAGLDPADDGMAGLEQVAALYECWIDEHKREAAELEEAEFRTAAAAHLAECERALERMRSGIKLLRENPTAARAFRLANHAILLQQLRARGTPRETVVDGRTGRFAVREALDVPDWRRARGRGAWRPFQIAFILASIRSVADRADRERETVELIWFPTGGGKTEAYLGLAAFALFHRRLVDPSDEGVEVLMRYTLRLLTAQQFQRAAALTCAMEHLRTQEDGLGEGRFSIGIWLGNAATPGRRAEAKAALKKLNSGEKYAENPFILLRCPWCSAQVGPVRTEGRAGKGTPKVAGYVESGGTVVFRCPDTVCEFRTGLPIFVIDEDIYDSRPSMVIGTVDKFATLAWRPEARALFGIGPLGTRTSSPPGTIIQDELHLISGPLGSVVGLYEAVVEELCTDNRAGARIRPKIISSTATIRRYRQQINSLYDRDDIALFPPRGLDASDSFFARYAREPDGSLSPGRIYVGVHGAGLGSAQTAQVRTFASLLQAPQSLPPDERDPWWTLMIFFNSLRELGTSVSLLQSDIPDYLGAVRNRLGLDPSTVRYLRHVKELTSRLRSDEVPRAIDDLAQPSSSEDPVDVCLASNIIEVGIDIDRLSLMAVFGQPKTTAQYIQVTGRVGRRWWERPGLVVTIFSPSKPRDRSHFEKFRSYHERLYAQVEPTSVTPFSPPVLDRVLHAALCAYVRQHGKQSLKPWPVPRDLVGEAFDLFLGRVENVDDHETANLKEVFTARISEWEGWERTSWSTSSWDDEQVPLLRRAGEWAPPAAARISWSTPTSMRNVDAECMADVTLRYAQEQGDAVV